MPKDLAELEKKIGFLFSNKALLHQALIHRSYLNENPEEGLEHNERLEFLGDAVLELVVTENLYKNHPNPEGDLTNWRASLVNTVIMGEVGDDMGLNDFLYLSRGEAKDKGKARQAILANTMESIIGALYLDLGYEAAKSFIENTILVRLPNILKNKLYRDAKSMFQEAAQNKVDINPSYKVISESGPDHAKNFKVGVFLAQDKVAEGRGESKQEAEQAAARAALVQKNWS